MKNKMKNQMKNLSVSLLVLIAACASSNASTTATTATAETRFEQMEKFREIQRLEHVEGDRDRALDSAQRLLSQVPRQDPLYIDLQTVIARLDKADSKNRLQAAINYVTGKKSEIYCRNVGLVEITGEHNDGAKSRLILVRGSRNMNQTYSRMTAGDWSYELSNDYRKPMNSDLFATGTAQSYKISEIRELPNSRFDKGIYRASWSGTNAGSNVWNSYATNGETLEPAPMYMATDYHLWGNVDAGFLIDFKVGSESRGSSREPSGSLKEIVLNSTRTVSDHLPTHRYTDSKGKSHEFNDCYRVRYTITLKELQDRSNRQ